MLSDPLRLLRQPGGKVSVYPVHPKAEIVGAGLVAVGRVCQQQRPAAKAQGQGRQEPHPPGTVSVQSQTEKKKEQQVLAKDW